ncbi:hypothetical protein ACIOJD_23705 [Streptomyces sp. NPDC088116]|uniref:hypothetical protein n=1 Tax=Streptomyces sp. NPDC088116 TaxID=3365825 RepID=UPI003803187F
MSNDQQYPYGQYGDQGHGRAQGQIPGQDGRYPDSGGQDSQGSQGSQGWVEPQQQEQGQQEQAVAQTWEGQTWDTQYQPQLQWQQGAQGQQPQQAPYAPPAPPTPSASQTPYAPQTPYAQQGPYAPQGPAQAYQPQQAAPAPSAADTAYLPPQGGYSLPQEPPAGAAAAPAAAQPAPARPAPAAGPGADADGYSAPTTMGSTRMTAAQRARAEGRSPIIPPGMQPAGLTALLGLLLAGGAALGTYGLVVPLVLLQAVTAAGWFRLNGMWPARQGIALAFLGGVTADIVLLIVGRESAPAAIIGTLGVWVLLTVVLQLRSRAGADERMEGLMATVASAALTILATGHLAAVPDAVVVGAVAVAAATVARALPLPGTASVVVALLAAAGAGVAVGGMTDLGAAGALLGLGAGVCALVGLRAASYDYPSRFVHMTAGVALPLTAAAPAVYLLGRALA